MIDFEGAIYLLADLFGVRPKDIEPWASGALETTLSSLHPRERLVLELRYGLRDGRRRTLEELRPALGNVSRERVRQIQRQAFGRLQHPTGSDALAAVPEAWRSAP